jgi:short-subunit dehydrogenase
MFRGVLDGRSKCVHRCFQTRSEYLHGHNGRSRRHSQDFATYSASKAAAYSITQGLRDTLKEQGTAVVSVHPGPIATDMANAAGLGEIAEPASLVADGIVAALAAGELHVFPDTMARKFWSAYQEFARAVVEAEGGEA